MAVGHCRSIRHNAFHVSNLVEGGTTHVWEWRNFPCKRWLDYFEQFAGCRSVALRSGYAAAWMGVGWLK